MKSSQRRRLRVLFLPKSVFWSLFGLYFHLGFTKRYATLHSICAVCAHDTLVSPWSLFRCQLNMYENSPASLTRRAVAFKALSALFKELCNRIARSLFALCEEVAVDSCVDHF